MTRSLIIALVAIPLAYAAVGAAAPRAHDGATGIVKERMEQMKSMSRAMKELAHMFKGEVPYDAPAVAAAARGIERRAGAKVTVLFPEGSAGHPSEAKEAIWHDWATFEAKADDLATRASALAASAADGVDGAKGAFADLAGTCKACHRSFKED